MRGRRGERLQWLKNNLASGGVVHLSNAAEQCGVSQMTIRRDVDASRGELLLLAGRIFISDSLQSMSAYDLDAEKDSHLGIKQRLCAYAADSIRADDTIFIDCGSTLVHLIGALDRDLPLTVVTYALNVANAVSRLPNARLLLYGGLYHSSSQSFSGEHASDALKRIGINKAFISAAGVHIERGVSCFNFHEVAPKRAALEAAQQKILIADASKIDRVRPAFFADWDQFDTFITSRIEDDEARFPATKTGQPSVVQL
ncbi:DeoR/GlpR family DNA-binding transcription regulator [Salinisphaera sp.]|uniref:DeoR/GlpR family DNA-binding transcription regulator n=1 Tax=Salinisphaera sp. TaxID=1914330 RepID=UPI002D76D27F|nr:DeoR/GlpR family DNA-binding transcription regulator [Salinisphaera sp.]HET7314906.1 DeoR/GlpR family DNA-binding transcription regulator [Salinisphaera sp.]